MRRPLVGLLSDFGTRDWYVAAVKGVVLTRCPHAALVDITHEVPPQDVVAGSLVLAAALPWLPLGSVVLACVDPGVGTGRRIVAAHADGRFLVGPDNGLLWPALGQARTWRAVDVTACRQRLAVRSRTFESRDVMAPVAAALARGTPLARLGPPVRRLVPLPQPAVAGRRGRWHGQVIHVDAFGNLLTNLPGRLVRRAGVMVRCRSRHARVVSSYGRGRRGEVIAVVGGVGLVELAVRDGSAARALRAGRGTAVELRHGAR